MAFSPTIETMEDNEGNHIIEGYALKYDVLSQPLYWVFREKINPRALDETDMEDVVATLNHNFEKLLGRNVSKTLELVNRDDGLYYRILPPKSGAGPEALELIGRGDIRGSSFIFTIESDKWENLDTEDETREILKIRKIYEVGPVINPAYVQTTADTAKRSHDKYQEQNKPPERKKEPWKVAHALYELEVQKLKIN